MNRTILLTTAAAIALAATAGAANDYSNRRAPGFSLADSHYQQHDSQDYRGRVLLIDIMTTTCRTCANLADVLVEVKAKYGDDKVGILSVLTMPDNYQLGDRFAAEHKISWPVVFDSGQMIMSYLKITPGNPQVHFPHLFFIDKGGFIRADFGDTDEKFLNLTSISAEIDKLLK